MVYRWSYSSAEPLRTLQRRTALSGPSGFTLGAARTPAAEFKGTLLGKRIFVTANGPSTTIDELRAHLSQYNLTWLLRRIGELSDKLDGENAAIINGMPIPAYCLPHLALVAIETSSDAKTLIPGEADLAEAARIFIGLKEPPFTADPKDLRVFEFIIRMGYAQFSGRDDLRNTIARTWMLYGTIWQRTKDGASLDVAEAIRRETGLTLRQLMVFGLAYCARSSPGYFAPYSVESLAKLPPDLCAGAAEQEKFLNWVTATYEEIRRLGAVEIPDSTYDKYRLCPLLVKPVVRPDRPPAEGGEQIRVVPIPAFLVRRVTDGLYHALSTSSDRGGGTNPFRVAFGYAFQDYVGELLRSGTGESRVLPEWEFGPRRARRRTPDWIVLDGDRAVVIEVKQSALTLGTKMFGDLGMLSADLKRTLEAGARQLLAFRDALRAGSQGLDALRDITKLELLVVTHDAVPWANWVIRDVIAKNVPSARDVHICSIDDFENMQRYCWGQSPYDLLAAKRLGPDDANFQDFRDWLYGLGRPATPDHPALAQAFSELSSAWTGSNREPRLGVQTAPQTTTT